MNYIVDHIGCLIYNIHKVRNVYNAWDVYDVYEACGAYNVHDACRPHIAWIRAVYTLHTTLSNATAYKQINVFLSSCN